MMVISHTTRTSWTTHLHEKYGLEKSTAKRVVHLVVSEPRISSARPQSREELKETVAEIEQILEEENFEEFEGIDDHDAVCEELMGILKEDLNLAEGFQELITKTYNSTGKTRRRSAEALGHEAVNSPNLATKQSEISKEIIDAFIESFEEAEGKSKREEARALGELIALRDMNSVQETLQTLTQRIQENPSHTHLAHAQAELLSNSGVRLKPEPVSAASDQESVGEQAVRGADMGFAHRGEEDDEIPKEVERGVEGFVEMIEAGDLTLEEFDLLYQLVREEFTSGDGTRISFMCPQSEMELEKAVNAVEASIYEVDLTEFGEIEDQTKVREDLIRTLRADLGLTQNTGGFIISESNHQRTLANEKPSKDEPPEHLDPFINEFEELIKDGVIEFQDMMEIARWVGYRVRENDQE